MAFILMIIGVCLQVASITCLIVASLQSSYMLMLAAWNVLNISLMCWVGALTVTQMRLRGGH